MEEDRNALPGEDPDWDTVLGIVSQVVRALTPSSEFEDVAGDVLVELVSRRVQGAPVDDWGAFSRKVARNVCAKDYRRRSRAPLMLALSALKGNLRCLDTHRRLNLEVWFHSLFMPALKRDLTHRQGDVLSALLKDRGIKRIARDLGISPKSVREAIRGIVKKGIRLGREFPPPPDT